MNGEKSVTPRRWGALLSPLVIFAVAVVIHAPSFDPAGRLTGRGYETFQVALSIAQSGEFANPFASLPTGATAHLAPLFPAFLAAIIRVVGAGATGWYVVQWAAVIALALQLSLLPLLARGLRLNPGSGEIAALAFLAAAVKPHPQWEAAYGALATVMLTLILARMAEGWTWRSAAGSGVAWGVTVLLMPVALPPFLIWLVASRAEWRKRLVALALFALTLVPWLVRNYAVFGKPVFVRGNLGLELRVSNNDCARLSLAWNRYSGCFRRVHPNENRAEAERVRELGEVEYERSAMQEVKGWITHRPERFARLTWQRFVAFWFPTNTGRLFRDPTISPLRGVLYLATLLSIGGIWMLFRTRPVAAWILLLWLAAFPTIYYFLAFNPRYRVPILWATLLPAAHLVVMALDAARQRIAR